MSNSQTTTTTNRLRPSLALALAALAALLLVPSAAQAAVASSDGTTTRLSGDAAAESVIVDVSFAGEVTFSGPGVIAGTGCYGETGSVACPNGLGGIEMSLGGGDDIVTSIVTSPAPASLRVDLGDGNDSFSGQENADQVAGGGGDDKLVSRGGGDGLDGGPGNDTLEAGDGSDQVLGGDGDDRLSGDSTESRSADLIDGGAGSDSVDDYYTGQDPATAPRVTVTLGAGADDGLPGEGDDLRGIERVQAAAALDFSGDEGNNEAVAAEVGGASALRGNGGADVLTGTNSDDSIDGGSGDDALTGGYGNDTIVGGPGSDRIDGDRSARCNEMHCDLDAGSAADSIDARDGATDTVACGPGPDSVKADAADVVAADCETVEKPGAPNTHGGEGGEPKLSLARKLALGKALAKGIRIRVDGATANAPVALSAQLKKRVVARGAGKADAAGSAVVVLRFGKAARRSLGHKASVKLTVTGAGASTAVTLKKKRGR
ncbi:MAG TPA: hypothetical protein VEB65_06890 [Solirubrobacterales bacterium]|nr:hypothetical protein [Solirubrobacterales bacterium]